MLLDRAVAQSAPEQSTTTTAPVDLDAIQGTTVEMVKATLPKPSPHAVPDKGPALVTAPVYLSVTPLQPVQVSVPAGADMMTVAAVPDHLVWQFEDGTLKRCPYPGTQYDPGSQGADGYSDCVHKFESSSVERDPQHFVVRALLHWKLVGTLSSSPETEDLGTATTSNTLDLRVTDAVGLNSGAVSQAPGKGGPGKPSNVYGDVGFPNAPGAPNNPGDAPGERGGRNAGEWFVDGLKALGRGTWGVLDFGKDVVVGVGKGAWRLGGELVGIGNGALKMVGVYGWEQMKSTWGGFFGGVHAVFTTNPLTTLKGIWDASWSPIRDAWKAGQPGEAIGLAAFEILALVVGTKGLGKIGKAGKAVEASAGVIRGAQAVRKVVTMLPPGKSRGVYVVRSVDELDELFGNLTKGGLQIEMPTYNGKYMQLDDGSLVGRRLASKSGGATIDINLPGGEVLKVHIDP